MLAKRFIAFALLMGACSSDLIAGTETFSYDELGRLKVVEFTDGRTTTYTLDAAGNRVNVQTTIDTTAPTDPTSLSGASPNSTTVNLSWTASSDTGGSGLASYRVERCQNAGCSGFAELPLPMPTTNAFTDTTVSGSTVYQYRVRARDGRGNNSNYSNVFSVTTPDSIPPTTPTSLIAGSVTYNSVAMSWTAATDSGGSGLASYRIQRCQGNGCSNFAEINSASGSSTSFTDATVAASTAYSYRVSARDGAGLNSGFSNAISVTTAPIPDTTKPTPPTNVTATPIIPDTTLQIHVQWTASTDSGGSGLQGYYVRRNGLPRGTVAAPSVGWWDTSVTPGATYTYTVFAFDGANNVSDVSNSVTVIASIDNGPPTSPGAVSFSNVTYNSMTVSWGAASDDVGVSGYDYQVNGGGWQNAGNVLSINLTGLSPSTSYTVQVRAKDAAGNVSVTPSQAAQSTTPIPDTTPPTAPTSLGYGGVTATTAQLSWAPSTDNVGVTGYRIYRNGSAYTTTTGTLFNETGLAQYTIYSYVVRAYDAAGLESGDSNMVAFRTLDATPPTQPTIMSITSPNSNTVNISWSASSDAQSGMQNYQVIRNGSVLETVSVATTSFSDSTTSGRSSYSYVIRAIDNSGNYNDSSPSNITTLDTIPPSTPTGFTATAVDSSTINLSWNASSDTGGSGVMGYRLNRNGGLLVGLYTGTSYSDAGLQSSTTYSYEVYAIDNDGNWSSVATSQATTPAPPMNVPAVPGNLRANVPLSNRGTNYQILWDTPTTGPVSYYILEQDYNAGQSVAEMPWINAPATSMSFTNQPSGTYSYRVKACNSNNQCSAYSPSKSRGLVCNVNDGGCTN